MGSREAAGGEVSSQAGGSAGSPRIGKRAVRESHSRIKPRAAPTLAAEWGVVNSWLLPVRAGFEQRFIAKARAFFAKLASTTSDNWSLSAKLVPQSYPVIVVGYGFPEMDLAVVIFNVL